MIFRKYNEFIGETKLNENVQQAKAWLKKREIDERKKRGDDRDLRPEEIKQIESDRDFLKIKDKLSKNPGYVYTFVKFFYAGKIPLDVLFNEDPQNLGLYEKLKNPKISPFLSLLPKNLEKYADGTTEEEVKRDFEQLEDDLLKIPSLRSLKKFVDKLPDRDFVSTDPKDKGTLVKSFKQQYLDSTDEVKRKVAATAEAFAELESSQGEASTKDFFSNIRQYRTLTQVLGGAADYIKSLSNVEIRNILKNIEKVNQKYGEKNGIDIIYNQNQILILEFKSYQANHEINGNIIHCIAQSLFHWNTYVGGDSKYTRQYYVYNYNLTDNKSVIGITIGPKYSIEHCADKQNHQFDMKPYLKGLKIPFEILAPMTPEDIENKKKRVTANREIAKTGLSLAQVQKYYEEGGDPNAQNGRPLVNAVNEDDYEKAKWLLEYGAMPSIGDSMKYAKNLKMIQLLVTHRAELTPEVFLTVANDYDAVKYLLSSGMNPNSNDGFPLKTAAINNDTNMIKLLLDNGASVDLKRYHILKRAAEEGSVDALQMLLDKLVEVKPNLTEAEMSGIMTWAKGKPESIKVLAQVSETLFGVKKTKEMVKKI